MSGATAGGSTAAIAAAAARRRQQQEEEEQMTKYQGSDLDGWEFKIVRSSFGRFGKPEIVRRVCEEEARAGWELLEKFDDYRLRFKRRTDKRANDQYLDIDPYRTSFGMGEGRTVLFIVGLAIALFGAVLLTVFLAR